MINFTTIRSNQFWGKNMPELSSFFEDMEGLEYWAVQEDEIFPFLVFFEIQLNRFTNISDIIKNQSYFNDLIEIFSYLKLGCFSYIIQEINKEDPSFIISCLLNCKQENTTYEKLFIERFKLLDRYNFLSRLFNNNKVKLIRTIIAD